MSLPDWAVKEADEHWKLIPGFAGAYTVSNLGRVKSYLVPGNPKRIRGTGFFMSLSKNRNGYLYVSLRGKKHSVHNLVLAAFQSSRPTKNHHGGHLNGIRTDNRLSNLAWVTPQENQDHRKLHGTGCIGSKNPQAKLTETTALEVHRLHRSGIRGAQIARQLKLHRNTIYDVLNGRRWAHLDTRALKQKEPGVGG